MVESFAPPAGPWPPEPVAREPWAVPEHSGGYGPWPEPPAQGRHARDEPPGGPGGGHPLAAPATGAFPTPAVAPAPAPVPMPVDAPVPAPAPVHATDHVPVPAPVEVPFPVPPGQVPPAQAPVRPPGRAGGTGAVAPDAYREFTRRMLALHQVLPHTAGQMPMCSCGSVARICPVVNSAHELLGQPVPWACRPDRAGGRAVDG